MYKRKPRKPKPPFKSIFEETVAENLELTELYEKSKVAYRVPETNHKYTPDFYINEYLVIETKGKFTSQDRYKMACVKEQYPRINFVLYFQNANVPIRKGSMTKYWTWAEKNGFTWYCSKTKPLTPRELTKLIKESLDANQQDN